MAFSEESARKAAKSRWGEKDPNSLRTIQLRMKISPDEDAILDAKSKEAKLSRTETVVQALKQFDPKAIKDTGFNE